MENALLLEYRLDYCVQCKLFRPAQVLAPPLAAFTISVATSRPKVWSLCSNLDWFARFVQIRREKMYQLGGVRVSGGSAWETRVPFIP